MSTLGKDLKVAEASRLAAKMRLTGVHVSGIQARMRAPELEGELGWTLLPMKLRWALLGSELRVVVPVSLHVLRQREAATPARNIAEIGVLLRLDYEVVANDSDDAIESFVGVSGCMHAWPYIRSEIHQLSVKLELPPLLLPPVVSGDVQEIVASVSRLQPPARKEEAPPKKKKLAAKKGASGQRKGTKKR